jgi:hypothetical protein
MSQPTTPLRAPPFTPKHDAEGLHGYLSELSPSEIDDLIAYVLSL